MRFVVYFLLTLAIVAAAWFALVVYACWGVRCA